MNVCYDKKIAVLYIFVLVMNLFFKSTKVNSAVNNEHSHSYNPFVSETNLCHFVNKEEGWLCGSVCSCSLWSSLPGHCGRGREVLNKREQRNTQKTAVTLIM